MFPSSDIMKIERKLSRWRGKKRNKGKCFPESTGRLKDNVMLLISMQLFEEVATRRVLKEMGKEAWMLWARENSRLMEQHKSGFEDRVNTRRLNFMMGIA